MKIIEIPNTYHSDTLYCKRCETKFQVDHNDLKVKEIETKRWFRQSLFTNTFFVECPTCHSEKEISEGNIPFIVKDRIIKTFNQSKIRVTTGQPFR
jgi:Zn finger protein HypA/HybF involved in hydrogenase expression